MIDMSRSETRKNTLVVNLYAGPGAGKTTCGLLIAGELKKHDVVTEYVPEYAKELAWDGETKLLDGSCESESIILNEKIRRISRLIGKVDVIVIDSPILQSAGFVKGYHPEFEQYALQIHNLYNNFNIFVQRSDHYEKSGCIHSFKQSKSLDKKIRKILDRNDIYYITYQHEAIDTMVEEIQTTLRKFQNRG